MTDNDVRKLKRIELLEMLIQTADENEQLKAQLAQLEERLSQRDIAIDNAGSIAEASLNLSSVFAEAQRAADQYLENVRRQNEGCTTRAEQIVREAEEQGAEILKAVHERCAKMEAETEEKCTRLRQQTESDCLSLRNETESDCERMRQETKEKCAWLEQQTWQKTREVLREAEGRPAPQADQPEYVPPTTSKWKLFKK